MNDFMDDFKDHPEPLKGVDVDDFFIEIRDPFVEDAGKEISFYCYMYDAFYDWVFGKIDWKEYVGTDQSLDTILFYDIDTGGIRLEVLYTDYGNYNDGRFGNRNVKVDDEAYVLLRDMIGEDVDKTLAGPIKRGSTSKWAEGRTTVPPPTRIKENEHDGSQQK